MWSSITLTDTHDQTENDSNMVIITFSIVELNINDIVPRTMHHAIIPNVLEMIHDISRSCNSQHNTPNGGEINQLLLDYHRCAILLDGESELSVHAFVRRVRDCLGAEMARHVVVLCTQGVLAGFMELAMRELDANMMLVDQAHAHAGAQSLRYNVYLRSTDHVDIFIRKQLSIFDLSEACEPVRLGWLNIGICFRMERRAGYSGSYKFVVQKEKQTIAIN